MDRATAEYDAAAKRYLNQSKAPGRWRSSDTGDKADKARLDMLHAEVHCHAADPASMRIRSALRGSCGHHDNMV